MAMTTSGVRSWVRQQGEAYRAGEERPLAGYAKLMSLYTTGTLAAGVLARKLGRTPPAQLSPWDATLLTVATHRLARTISKDPVTSPIRAPFTVFDGTSGPGELAEQVRGHGLQHSIGELLTCPMCLAQWVATGFTLGLVFAPTVTRLAMATFTAVAGADFLQHLYVLLEKASE